MALRGHQYSSKMWPVHNFTFENKIQNKQFPYVTYNMILFLEQGLKEKSMHRVVIVTGDASFAATSGQTKSLHKMRERICVGDCLT